MLVEPGDVSHEFLAKVAMSHWDDDLTRKLGFQRAEESLDDRNAAMLANGAVTRRLDSLAFIPTAKVTAIKDAVAIADDMFGFSLAKGST